MEAFEIKPGQWAVESATGYIFGARFVDRPAALAFIVEKGDFNDNMRDFIIHNGIEFQLISYGGLSYRLIKRQHGQGPNSEFHVQGKEASGLRDAALAIERAGRTIDEMCAQLWKDFRPN